MRATRPPVAGALPGHAKTGRLLIDKAKVKAEGASTASTRCPPATPTCPPRTSPSGYKNLLEAERGFRDMKSTLELRPVLRRIALELQRLHLVTLTVPDDAVEQTTPPSPLATQILAATRVKAPPRIIAITPT